VADTFVIWVFFKVRSVMSKVFNALLFGKLAQDINVAVSAFVGSEDVVVGIRTIQCPKPWHHSQTRAHTDSAGTTDIMSHQQVNINPDIVPAYHRPTGGFSQDFSVRVMPIAIAFS